MEVIMMSRAMAMAAAAVVLAAVMVLAVGAVTPASGQAVTAAAVGACTKSLLTSFTPCLAFISNGSGAGTWSPPSADCCTGLAAVVNVSTSCAELILAGGAAVGVQVNCTLAVVLPKQCNSTVSFSLECTNTPMVNVSSSGPAAATSAAPLPAPTTTTATAPVPAPKAPSPVPQLAARSSAGRRGGGASMLPALAAMMLGVGVMMA